MAKVELGSQGCGAEVGTCGVVLHQRVIGSRFFWRYQSA